MISERNVRFFAVLSVVALFGSGIGVGIALDRLLLDKATARPPQRHRPMPEVLLNRFAEKLDLSPEQKQATHVIMEGGRTDVERILGKSDPELEAIRKNMEERIADLLNPEQAEKHRKMLSQECGLLGGPPCEGHPSPHGRRKEPPPPHKHGPPMHRGP